VADLPDPAMQENTVLDHAVRMLSQGAEITVDIPHRISRVYGRQLSIAAPDGGRSSVAVFFHKRRLYQIEGTVLPTGTNPTSDAIRFRQSLVFTDDSTNGGSEPIVICASRADNTRSRLLRFHPASAIGPATSRSGSKRINEALRRSSEPGLAHRRLPQESIHVRNHDGETA